LLIITFRPAFEPPWIGLPHTTAVTINWLGHRDINAMIDRIVGNKFLPPGVREDMIERTDGIPLFIEEMTKAMLEAESEEEATIRGQSNASPCRTSHSATSMPLIVQGSDHATVSVKALTCRECLRLLTRARAARS
jgi:predicted ATPase